MTSPKLAAKSVKKPKSAAKGPHREVTHADREAQKGRMRRLYDAMTPAEKAERRWRQCARPPVPRKGSVRGKDARTVGVAMAFCDWSDLEEVFRMYVAAAVMTELTGVTYVVDHAVPVANPLVCGLHTHTNMQVITNAENMRKSNWLWPDMWPIDWSSMTLIESALEEQGDRLETANHEQDSRFAARLRAAGA